MNSDDILHALTNEGWCVIPSVIPDVEVKGIRKSVLETTYQNDMSYGLGKFPRDVSSTTGLLAHDQSFAKYLSHQSILDPVETIFGPHVRISYTTAIINNPGNERGGWHSDWPFNQNNAGHIPAPYPNAVMHITTIWMLSPFTEENGGTLIVPKSHKLDNNPTGDNGFESESTHIEEIQATGSAGDVLIFDSRLWHATSPNTSNSPRVGIAVRYAPWWLNLDILMPGSDERNRMVNEPGARENEVGPISSETYDHLPKDVKPLMRHWVRD